MSLDDLRRDFPTLGFAVYALEPGGPVTLEIHQDGEVYTFRAATEAATLAQAFPITAAIKAADTPTPGPPVNIFD